MPLHAGTVPAPTLTPAPALQVHRIVAESVELERGYCCEALSVALIGMNAELMGQVRPYHHPAAPCCSAAVALLGLLGCL